MEALTVVDMLRRAGIDITTVSISRNLQVESSHGVTVTADCTWVELSADDVEWLVLPGGMPGTKHLSECKPLVSLLQRHAAANKHIAAICAAPSVLGQAGLLNGYKATCYPGCEGALKGAEYKEDRVVVDGNIVTSRGVGTAIDFACEIIKLLEGERKSADVRKSILAD